MGLLFQLPPLGFTRPVFGWLTILPSVSHTSRRTLLSCDCDDLGVDSEQQGTTALMTALIGREVYSTTGIFVGEVEDVRIDIDKQQATALALAELNSELFANRIDANQGVFIPYRWVRAVGDILLIVDIVERLQSDDDADTKEEAVA